MDNSGPAGVCFTTSFGFMDNAGKHLFTDNSDRSVCISISFCWTCVRLLFGHLWIQCFLKISHNVSWLALAGKSIKGNGGKEDREEEYVKGYGEEAVGCPYLPSSYQMSDLDGFTLIQFDWDILKTQKTVGGGALHSCK